MCFGNFYSPFHTFVTVWQMSCESEKRAIRMTKNFKLPVTNTVADNIMEEYVIPAYREDDPSSLLTSLHICITIDDILQELYKVRRKKYVG